MKRSSLSRSLLILVIVSLCISAFIAICIFLVGDFNETEGRILATTSALFFFSLLGLCSMALYDRRRYQGIVALGLFFIVIGFILALLAIWDWDVAESIWKPLVIFIVLAISVAQVSLLLLVSQGKSAVAIALRVTICVIVLFTVMVVSLILGEFESETYYKLLAVVGILDVLGTIVTPIINKVVRSPKAEG